MYCYDFENLKYFTKSENLKYFTFLFIDDGIISLDLIVTSIWILFLSCICIDSFF